METSTPTLLDSFINLVSNVGFPIVVTAYLLIRLEAKLEKLTEALLIFKEALRDFKMSG